MKRLLFWILIAAAFPIYCVTSEQKQEAERYFNEYKAKRHATEYDTARKKLEAAIALNPDEPRYLYELADFTASAVYPFTPKKPGEYFTTERFMAQFSRFMESNRIYDRFVNKFHTYPKCLYHPSNVLFGLADLYRNLTQPLSPLQQKIISQEMKDFRAKVLPEMQKHFWKYNITDGINSLKEYNLYCSFQERCVRLMYFLNYHEQVANSYQATVKFLELSTDFFKKHPELKNKANVHFEYSFGFPNGEYPGEALNDWKELLIKDKKLVSLAQSHPNPRVRRYGDALAIHQACYQGKISKAQLKQMTEKFNKKYPKQQYMFLELLKDFQVPAPPMVKEEPESIPQGKLQAEWLAGMDITKRTKGIEDKNLVKFVAADECDSHIYLLSIDRRQSAKIYNKPIDIALKIYDYDIKANRLKKLWTLDKFNVKSHYDTNWIFHATKDYLLIGRNDQIILVSKSGTRTYRIKDLPVGTIRDVTMYKNRIYAFLGRIPQEGTAYALETMLMSCDINGKDRKFHINTMRSDKQNIMDKQKPFIVSTLIADSKHNRLLFIAESPVGGLWEFYPDSGKFNQLIKKSRYECNHSWGRKAGDKLYCSFGVSQRKYYVYNLDTNKLTYLFYDKEDKYAKREKIKPEYQKYLNIGQWFFPTQTDIWFAQHFTLILCLSQNKSMDECRLLLKYIKPIEILVPNIMPYMRHHPLVDERCVPFPLYLHQDGKTMLVVLTHHILALKKVPK